MKHASAHTKVYTFSHPQYERIANTRGWRSFIFGLALAERQRAVPPSATKPASSTQASVLVYQYCSTYGSVLEYLHTGTGVLSLQYWRAEKEKFSANGPTLPMPTQKWNFITPKNTHSHKEKKSKIAHSIGVFPPFGDILLPATSIRPRPSDKKRFPNHLYESSLNRNVKFQVFKAFLETFFVIFE